MYLEFYGLKEKPFQISSDPRFLWLGEKHKEALAILRYGVLDNRGFLLLTGDVGTGKTTLINNLVNSLGKEVLVAAVTDPGLEKLDFFNYIAKSFHIPRSFASKGEFLYYLGRFLNQAYNRGKTVLLIIDEAQRLPQDLLEEVRLLSNIEKQETKLINIFLVGQNEINDILSEPQNRALRQRITINFNIDPLNEQETAAYIRHRLKVAGCDKRIFSQEAVYEVYQFSGGFPRLINVICDHALLSGYVKEARIISPVLIRECAQELSLPRKFRMGGAEKPEQDPAPDAPPLRNGEPSRRSQVQPAVRRQGTAQAVRQYDRRVMGYLLVLVVLLGMAGFLYEPRMLASAVHQIREIRQLWESSPADERAAESRPIESAAPEPPAADAGTAIPESESRSGRPAPVAKAGPDGSGRLEDAGAPADPPAETGAGGGADVPPHRPDGGAASPAEGAATDVAQPSMPPESDAESPPEPPVPFAEGSVPLPELPEEPVVIQFGHDSNALPDGTYERLDRLAEILKQRPEVKVMVRGFTDSIGPVSYNVRLSEFRANVIKTYLIGKGVRADNIEAEGLGPRQPVRPNTTLAGRRANRRIEIEFITGEGGQAAQGSLHSTAVHGPGGQP